MAIVIPLGNISSLNMELADTAPETPAGLAFDFLAAAVSSNAIIGLNPDVVVDYTNNVIEDYGYYFISGGTIGNLQPSNFKGAQGLNIPYTGSSLGFEIFPDPEMCSQAFGGDIYTYVYYSFSDNSVGQYAEVSVVLKNGVIFSNNVNEGPGVEEPGYLNMVAQFGSSSNVFAFRAVDGDFVVASLNLTTFVPTTVLATIPENIDFLIGGFANQLFVFSNTATHGFGVISGGTFNDLEFTDLPVGNVTDFTINESGLWFLLDLGNGDYDLVKMALDYSVYDRYHLLNSSGVFPAGFCSVPNGNEFVPVCITGIVL